MLASCKCLTTPPNKCDCPEGNAPLKHVVNTKCCPLVNAQHYPQVNGLLHSLANHLNGSITSMFHNFVTFKQRLLKSAHRRFIWAMRLTSWFNPVISLGALLGFAVTKMISTSTLHSAHFMMEMSCFRCRQNISQLFEKGRGHRCPNLEICQHCVTAPL